MHTTAIKARLAVQVGHLYKKRNAERGFVRLTHRAHHRRLSALLRPLRRHPTCAAARAAPKGVCDCAESQILFSTGCYLSARKLSFKKTSVRCQASFACDAL